MDIRIIAAHLPQIFDQIQDGTIPKRSIEELILCLVSELLVKDVKYIDFRNASWEEESDRFANVISMEEFRSKKGIEAAKRNMYCEEEQEYDGSYGEVGGKPEEELPGEGGTSTGDPPPEEHKE